MLLIDPTSCGACGHACEPGEICDEGLCFDPEAAPSSVVGPSQYTIDPSILIDAAGATCATNNEAHAAQSQPNADTDLYVAYQRSGGSDLGLNNWGTAWNSWDNNLHYPSVATNYFTLGDPWATVSPSQSLSYVSYLASDDGGATKCVGIGATSGTNLDNSIWTYPVTCIDPAVTNSDGPAIYWDRNTSDDLWAVETRGGNQVVLSALTDCNSGQPGGANCPVMWTQTMTNNAVGHATVSVSTCGDPNLAVVAYRENDDDIWLAMQYSMEVAPILAPIYFKLDDLPFEQSSDCANAIGCTTNSQVPKCSNICGSDCGPAGCWAINPKPQVVARYDTTTSKCYAYVVYSYSAGPATDGETYFKTRMKIVDLTNVSYLSPPVVVKTYDSHTAATVGNDFSGMVSARPSGSRNVGFFWYRQVGGDPCNTIIQGKINAAGGLASMTLVNVTTNGFKSINTSFTGGMGHYITAIENGISGGYLYPTWAVPNGRANANCTMCQGSPYQIRIAGTRVLP